MKKKIQTTEKNVQKLTMKQLPKEDRPYEKPDTGSQVPYR